MIIRIGALNSADTAMRQPYSFTVFEKRMYVCVHEYDTSIKKIPKPIHGLILGYIITLVLAFHTG